MDGNSVTAQARLAGLFALAGLAAGGFADSVVRAALVVPGNGRESARNIADYPWLYRTGALADIIMLAATLVLIALLYRLCAPGGRSLSRIAVLLGLTGIAVQAGNLLLYLAPLHLLADAPHPGMGMAQVQTLVRLSIALHADMQGVGLLFLGLYSGLIGWLAIRARLVPRPVGALMIAAGLVQFLGRAVALLAPVWWDRIAGQCSLLPLLGTAAFALWLLIVGVRPTRALA